MHDWGVYLTSDGAAKCKQQGKSRAASENTVVKLWHFGVFETMKHNSLNWHKKSVRRWFQTFFFQVPQFLSYALNAPECFGSIVIREEIIHLSSNEYVP